MGKHIQKKITTDLAILMVVGLAALGVLRQQLTHTTPQDFVSARVAAVLHEESLAIESPNRFVQTVSVELPDGRTFPIEVGSQFQPLSAQQLLNVGQPVIVTRSQLSEAEAYVISDINRVPLLSFLGLIFAVATILVARMQGARALVGLLVTAAILLAWVVPALLSGANPILVCLIGSVVIGGTSVYMAHGWNLKSHLALGTIGMTLLAVSLLSLAVIQASQLVGLGSHEAYVIQFNPDFQLNAQGLLLGGIMLGTVGILDDVVVSQIGIVFQLKQAKRTIKPRELYHRSLAIGQDHVASLVNTLVLAYAGANLPLFILFVGTQRLPWWVSLSNELIAEEVVRTLVGSLGIIAAVPLATILAVWMVDRVKMAAIKASFTAE